MAEPALPPAPPPVPGPAVHVVANPISPVAEVAARLAAPKTQRSAEDVLADLDGKHGRLGQRTVRCILKPDHPLDHTTYGGVQFAKFTEVVSNGGAIRFPQQGAINHLSDADVARALGDARDCIARFYPGGRVKNVDGTYTARRGKGFEGRISQLGETFVQAGDMPTYVPPRVVVNGEKRWIPVGLADVEAAEFLGVTPIAVNEARREADVRSLIALEFDPKPMTEMPDSLEAAIEDARKRANEPLPIPKHGDPGPTSATSIEGLGAMRGLPMATPGTRHTGGDATGVSDEAVAQALRDDVKRTGIATLEPSPEMGLAKDAGVKIGATGKIKR